MATAKEYINLLPGKEKSPSALPNGWLAGGLCVLLLWAGLFGLKAMQWRDARSGLRALAPRQAALERELAALRTSLGLTPGAEADQTALIRNLLRERVLWSEVFLQFSHIIPRGVWFDSLEGAATGRPEIRIRGGAFNYRLISDFMLSMERTDYFDKPELIFAQRSVMQGRDIVAFEIRCGVKKPRGGR